MGPLLNISSLRHNCVHVLFKIGFLNGIASELEFDSTVLGIKFLILNLPLIRRIHVLRNKLIIASLPGKLKILVRYESTDTFILNEIYNQNIYERHYHPKLGDIVFDIGSHIGIFSLKASRIVGTNGVVYSFEPNPINFVILKRNVMLNKASNVKISNKAVSSQNKILQLYLDPENTGGSSVQIKTGKTAQISVSSITLDNIINEKNIQEVNFLKLDVEGHELEILKGANHFLNICKHIAMETHEKMGGPSNNQLIEELENHSFKVELSKFCENNDMIYGWKYSNS